VKWGMTPVQALRSATTIAADLIGWSADVGTIEKGKFAEIVAVAGDPHADIAEMSRATFVIQGGQIIRNYRPGGGEAHEVRQEGGGDGHRLGPVAGDGTYPDNRGSHQ